jgi:uncharacterized membrane protein YhdT
MKIEEHRRDLLSVGRTYLWIMVFFFMINLLGTLYSIGNSGFMFWFNFTCFIGTIIFISWLDWNKYKIIEGKLK